MQCIKDLSPVKLGLLTRLLAVCFVVWEDVTTPELTVVTCDDHLTILVLELHVIGTDRVKDHVPKKIFLDFSVGMITKLHH